MEQDDKTKRQQWNYTNFRLREAFHKGAEDLEENVMTTTRRRWRRLVATVVDETLLVH